MTTPLNPIARLDVPLAQLEAESRALWAERDLRVHAREAGLTADEYRRQGREAEFRHMLADLDVDSVSSFPGAAPYPCPPAGGLS